MSSQTTAESFSSSCGFLCSGISLISALAVILVIGNISINLQESSIPTLSTSDGQQIIVVQENLSFFEALGELQQLEESGVLNGVNI